MVDYADDDSDDNDVDDYCDVIAAEAGQQQPLRLQLAEVASRPLVQWQVQGDYARQWHYERFLFLRSKVEY